MPTLRQQVVPPTNKKQTSTLCEQLHTEGRFQNTRASAQSIVVVYRDSALPPSNQRKGQSRLILHEINQKTGLIFAEFRPTQKRLQQPVLRVRESLLAHPVLEIPNDC